MNLNQLSLDKQDIGKNYSLSRFNSNSNYKDLDLQNIID